MKEKNSEGNNRKYNTGETSQELKEMYNPEGSLKRRVQLRLLDMLLYLDKVCKDNDIDYRIDGGTVLGALRHGGFIPWDDDIDVVIEDANDYNRLCRYLLNHPHPQYVLQNDKTDKGCIKYWSTLRDLKSEYVHLDLHEQAIDSKMKYKGLQIDIFPYEAGVIPSLYFRYAKLGRRERYYIVNCYWKARTIHLIRKYVGNPILHLISRLFGNKNMFMHSYGEGFPCRFHRDVLLPHKPISFEGYVFPGPADPDRFCKILYNDYMNLPPLDKRVSHLVTYNFVD